MKKLFQVSGANSEPGLHGGVQWRRRHRLQRPLRQHARHPGAPARHLLVRPVLQAPVQPIARYSIPQLGQKRSTCFQCWIRYALHVISLSEPSIPHPPTPPPLAVPPFINSPRRGSLRGFKRCPSR